MSMKLSLQLDGVNPPLGLQEWVSVAGVSVAFLAVMLAWITYRGAARDQARSHMHGLFREYLALRMQEPEPDEQAIIGFKFYALEEVYYWAVRERFSRLIPLKKSEYDAWMATIDHHIADGGDTSKDYFKGKDSLFGPGFAAHVKRVHEGVCHPKRRIRVFRICRNPD
jgi:hypothetical protein